MATPFTGLERRDVIELAPLALLLQLVRVPLVAILSIVVRGKLVPLVSLEGRTPLEYDTPLLSFPGTVGPMVCAVLYIGRLGHLGVHLLKYLCIHSVVRATAATNTPTNNRVTAPCTSAREAWLFISGLLLHLSLG